MWVVRKVVSVHNGSESVSMYIYKPFIINISDSLCIFITMCIVIWYQSLSSTTTKKSLTMETNVSTPASSNANELAAIHKTNIISFNHTFFVKSDKKNYLLWKQQVLAII